MARWEAVWSGRFPNLCSGCWTLLRDGEEVDVDLPFKYTPADTLGTYPECWIDGDWQEAWTWHEEGLECDSWCELNSSWLRRVADEPEWPAIYSAFAESDWRPGSCGGCL